MFSKYCYNNGHHITPNIYVLNVSKENYWHLILEMNPMATKWKVAQSITYHFNVASYLCFMFGCWRGTLLYLLKIRSRLPRLDGTTFSRSRFITLLWRWFVRVWCTTTARSRVGWPWRTAINLSRVSECPTTNESYLNFTFITILLEISQKCEFMYHNRIIW